MACSTGRCALRRFDGHGTSSYRPTNPESDRLFKSQIEAMMAERSRQDAGIFGEVAGVGALPVQKTPEFKSVPGFSQNLAEIKKIELDNKKTEYYSLSDSGIKK